MAANILTKELAVKLADKIIKSGATMRKDVQSLAVTAIGYANVHGDITIANKALEAVQSTKMQVRQFIAYCEAHGKLKFSKEGKCFTFERKEDVKTDVVELITHLAAMPEWHEFEIAKDVVVVSLYDKLEKLLKQIKEESLTPEEHAMVDTVKKATHDYALACTDKKNSAASATAAP